MMTIVAIASSCETRITKKTMISNKEMMTIVTIVSHMASPPLARSEGFLISSYGQSAPGRSEGFLISLYGQSAPGLNEGFLISSYGQSAPGAQ